MAIRDIVKRAALELGYPTLKSEQLEAITTFLIGKDVFVVLPTGYGKSLCFALLPAVFNEYRSVSNSIVVVVSPLVSIIQSMSKEYEARGLKIGYICRDMKDDGMKRGVMEGKYELVFFTPESLLSVSWRNVLQSPPYNRLVAFVVDEAHTVYKWGDTFRKSLRIIGDVRSLIPNGVNVMALSATATRTVRKVVSRRLGMHNPHVIAIPPCRSNIKYSVRKFVSFSDAFLSYVEAVVRDRVNADRIIIYCNTFKQCCDVRDYFYDNLKQNRFYPANAPLDKSPYRLVDMFTSLTDPIVKDTILTSFTSPDSILRVVIATSAFGMGVNCSNVRKVINVGVPGDIDDYIQQTGRVGRDGLPSEAILLSTRDDFRYASDKMKEYVANSDECRRNFLFSDYNNYVIDKDIKKQDCCDVCALLI